MAEQRYVHVILENAPECELDRAIITVPSKHDDPNEFINLAIHAVLENWILSPGDTIRIVQ